MLDRTLELDRSQVPETRHACRMRDGHRREYDPREHSEPGTVQEWLDRHIGAIGVFSGRAIGFVCLYGGCHGAILDPGLVRPIQQRSIVAVAKTAGTESRLVSNAEDAPFLAFLEEYTRQNSTTLGLDSEQ